MPFTLYILFGNFFPLIIITDNRLMSKSRLYLMNLWFKYIKNLFVNVIFILCASNLWPIKCFIFVTHKMPTEPEIFCIYCLQHCNVAPMQRRNHSLIFSLALSFSLHSFSFSVPLCAFLSVLYSGIDSDSRYRSWWLRFSMVTPNFCSCAKLSRASLITTVLWRDSWVGQWLAKSARSSLLERVRFLLVMLYFLVWFGFMAYQPL